MKQLFDHVKKNRWFYSGLFCIVVIAAFLRLDGLSNTPFVADEFLDVNATYGYYKTGQWQAWDFNHDALSVRDNKASDVRAWMYRAQVAWLFDYLEPTEFTVRLVSALWGILMTVILYFVTLSFTKNRWIALIASFLWAVSVPAIEINRKVRMYSMFAPIFLLFSWSLFQLIDAKVRCVCDDVSCSFKKIGTDIVHLQWAYFIPVVVFGAIAYHLHPLTANIVFVLFVYCIVMGIMMRTEPVARRYGAYVVLMLIGAISIKIVVPDVWGQFANSLVFFDDHWSYVGHIMYNYWHPLLGGMFILLGAWYVIFRCDDARPGVWIVSTFFTILFAAIFLWNRNVGPQYIFLIQAFGLILCAAGVYFIADYAYTHIGNKKIFVSIIIISLVMLPFYGYFFMKNNTYHITSSADRANYRKVFDYVKRNTKKGDVMITRNFRNYYWSGLDVPVFDFGSERSEEDLANEGKVKKITRVYVEEIVAQNPRGWVVIADNDEQFIEKEALQYFDDHFHKIDDSLQVRGDVSVYRWGEDDQKELKMNNL